MIKNHPTLVMGLCFWLVVGLMSAGSIAAGGSIVGLSPDIDELELYASPTDEEAKLMAAAGDFAFPTPILETSNNGMYKIQFKGADYWVISDDVESTLTREVDTACDPKMAGTVVVHGKRGAGEGCQ